VKLAILSDIHGNLTAFEAVLAELEREEINRIVCLGDVAVMGSQPARVIDRLNELRIPVVMGNTDAWLLEPTFDENANPLIAGPERWCSEQIGVHQLEFIRGFVATLEIPVGDLSVLCAHGSPRSYDDKMYSTTPREELLEMFTNKAPIMISGHTHQQMLRRLDEITLINPGSVGLAYSSASGGGTLARYAEYAVLDLAAGWPRVELRRTSFDHLEVATRMRESFMPHADYWANQWANARF
jgi:protein phosphatase